MKENFQIKLSSIEILVIAALLDYESVFGIEEILWGEHTDIKSLIAQQIRKLERKKLVRYDLDGVLHIASNLRLAITCICDADMVGVFCTNLKSGKGETAYILEKEGAFTILEQLSNGEYVIHMGKTIPLEKTFPCTMLSTQHHNVQEMMLFEEAECIKNQIQAFNYDVAKMCIKMHIKNSDVTETIAKILSGNCGYLSVQIYRRGDDMYNAIYHSLLVCVDNNWISLNLDENDVIHYNTSFPTTLLDEISSQFKSSEKRGVV